MFSRALLLKTAAQSEKQIAAKREMSLRDSALAQKESGTSEVDCTCAIEPKHQRW